MDYFQPYTDFLKKFLKPRQKLKVVFDCSNGTSGKVLKELFRKSAIGNRGSKIEAIFINDKPDGNFPGHGPNPLAKGAMGQVQKAVLKHRADLGMIFDADGDRVFFMDDLGGTISPDETGYLLLQELKPKKFAIGPIAGELLKNSSYQILDSRFFVSKVGHYFFKKLMREKKIPLGLEHSGHYYFGFPKENFYFDSGILAAIHIINFLSHLNIKLSTYLDKLPKYCRSGEINFKFQIPNSKSQILEKVEKFYRKQGAKISKLDRLTVEFKGGWLNLRPSNTENLLRLNVEVASEKILKEKIKEVQKLVKSKKL